VELQWVESRAESRAARALSVRADAMDIPEHDASGIGEAVSNRDFWIKHILLIFEQLI
jgi:hypothetical protein